MRREECSNARTRERLRNLKFQFSLPFHRLECRRFTFSLSLAVVVVVVFVGTANNTLGAQILIIIISKVMFCIISEKKKSARSTWDFVPHAIYTYVLRDALHWTNITSMWERTCCHRSRRCCRHYISHTKNSRRVYFVLKLMTWNK